MTRLSGGGALGSPLTLERSINRQAGDAAKVECAAESGEVRKVGGEGEPLHHVSSAPEDLLVAGPPCCFGRLRLAGLRSLAFAPVFRRCEERFSPPSPG